jgi:peptide/nickel transport system ATP-binding protein
VKRCEPCCDLFAELNDRLGVAYLFITHDLTVARAIPTM